MFRGFCLFFWWTSIVLVPGYIPAKSVWKFPLQYIVTSICFIVFLTVSILTGVKWHLIVDFICICQMIMMFSIFSDIWCHWYASSFEKCMFAIICPSLMIDQFLLLSYSCILDINLSLEKYFANISSHSTSCLFTLTDCFLHNYKLLSLM